MISRVAVMLVVGGAWLGYAQRTQPAEEAYRQNNVGVARLEQYDYSAATAAFRRALTASPQLAMARLNLAIALLYDGQLAAAATEGKAAVNAMPSSPQAHYVTGLIARADNRAPDALAAFGRVVQLDPEDAGSRVHIGQIHLADRRYKEAIEAFEAALAREPFNATAAYGLAVSLTRGGNRDAGGRAMERFQGLRDNPAAITYSTTYLEQGRYGEAIASTGLEADLVYGGVPPVRFTDGTTEVLRLPDPRGRPALADLDADGDLDLLLVSRDGLRVRRNVRGRFATGTTPDIRAAGMTAAIAGDYDNDGRPDVLAIGETQNRLYHQDQDEFRAVSLPAGADAGGPTATAAFADTDHDGDLDIFLAPPTRLLRNNGNGSFTDVTKESRLAGGASAVAVVPTDFDDRRDVDLLIVSDARPALFANQRDGTFRDVAADVGLPDAAAYTAVATGDLNKDGAPDFFFARNRRPGAFAMSRAGRFVVSEAPAGTIDAVAAQLFDYDGDGLLDLLTLSRQGPKLWRHAGASWLDVSARSLPRVSPGDVPLAATAGDLDGDGDVDVLVQLSTGRVRAWLNDGGARNSSLRVRLAARVSNRSAIGSKVDVRAGSLRHRAETSAATPPVAPADLVFGLGSRPRADVVRVLWPAGILQAEVDPPIASASIQELDRKPSSCPFLFTWNGSQFEFVTDFLGGGEMGYWVAPGVRNVPDPDEYIRIRGDQLRPRDGRYELRMTNELEEVVFLDRVQLVAVAHPNDADVFPNEGMRSEPRPFAITTARASRPPYRAFDHRGRDVLDRLAAVDRRYVDGFRLEPIQGYAEEHSLTLDLGPIPEGSPVRLLLTGWTDYAFSSDNVAAHQAGLVFHPPSLEIKDASGRWSTVMSEVGLPVGRPQTVVADLASLGVGSRESGVNLVRIVSTLRVYWDQILVDTSHAAPYTIARLEPLDAQLRWRGFSADAAPDGRTPLVYDYGRVSSTSPWRTMAGRYTRAGDVTPLVSATDDRFVVSAPGDEIAVSFDASALAPLPDGWTRTFLLHADGFSKEMNLHSASPDRVDPLPFHGMSAYPYPPGEHYPRTPAHDRYRAEYNTRPLGRAGSIP